MFDPLSTPVINKLEGDFCYVNYSFVRGEKHYTYSSFGIFV